MIYRPSSLILTKLFMQEMAFVFVHTTFEKPLKNRRGFGTGLRGDTDGIEFYDFPELDLRKSVPRCSLFLRLLTLRID